jgi:hypothetical protein
LAVIGEAGAKRQFGLRGRLAAFKGLRGGGEMSSIGKLERVDLRTIWRREDADFTPWLAKNIEYLNEVLGFDIAVEKIEERVGPYSVDIYGEDEQGNKVIIENQLERTDHTHLGQLLTYLVNLEAKTAIWVSAAPVEEHQHVVEWLNEITPDDVSFYLVRVEGMRMRGEQTVAPLFTVVEGPSVERKRIGSEKKEYAERHLIRREFWAQLLDALNARSPLAQNVGPSTDAWIGLALGMSGVSLNLVSTRECARAEIYVNRGDLERNKRAFDFLLSKKAEVEKVVGAPLDWDRMDDQVTSRIKLEKRGVNIFNRDNWAEMIEYLVDAALRMHSAFKEPVQQLRRLRDE